MGVRALTTTVAGEGKRKKEALEAETINIHKKETLCRGDKL